MLLLKNLISSQILLNFIEGLENLSKGEFIKRYLDSHSDIDEAILIDDNEDNINSCANIENLKACLTSWGYLKSPEGKMSEDDVLKIIKESV